VERSGLERDGLGRSGADWIGYFRIAIEGKAWRGTERSGGERTGQDGKGVDRKGKDWIGYLQGKEINAQNESSP